MEDIRLGVAYKLAVERHEREFGKSNVRIAFPTALMEHQHPEYTERPHRIIMVRPGALL